ncbi:hypothetical protein COU74_03695 [Candidatus Peregrinibacteria bacterium CG10_big_fil_rev_8_21_14_0_10_36_19]|nr:MAG: hypothetical protein COU74_03695 [Candidatus Peregrinibacteria bacterium CG10_big_fil_rev_8_21_14_0_10_36_19]
MKFFHLILEVFRSYDYRDKLLAAFSVALLLSMIVKMMVFPYGFFGFGKPNVYTEGVVSKAGIQNVNPLFVDYNEADREVSSLVFSGLMKFDPDKQAIVDDMAALSISEDKTVYTFKVRDGIRWHDGEKVTAKDAYFTFHNVIGDLGFQNEILKTNFAGVVIDLVDEMTIKFTLEKPNTFFVTNFTVGLLPEHVLGKVDPATILQSDFNKKPVGTGPYMVVDPVEAFSDSSMQITLERNPTYYGEISEIEFMKFISYPSMNDLVENLSSVNGVPKVTGEYVSNFAGNGRFNLLPYELPQYTAVFMNMESKILKDNLNVRLALQKAVDKKKLLESFVDKVPIDTPLMELDQEDWVYQSNVDQAQGALKEAGYLYKRSDAEQTGIRYNDDGEPLELNFIVRAYDDGTPQSEEVKKVIGFLTDAWRGIGVGLKLEFLDSDAFRERVASRSYDLLFVGQSLGYNLDTYSYWHSTQANPLGQNFSNYKSFRVDKLIESIRRMFDDSEREEDLKELAAKIKEDIPAIFLYRPVYYYATDGKIDGISMEGVDFPSDRLARISKWKFK